MDVARLRRCRLRGQLDPPPPRRHPHRADPIAGLSVDLPHPCLAMIVDGVTRAKGVRP
jgi:hypothetical protein